MDSLNGKELFYYYYYYYIVMLSRICYIVMLSRIWSFELEIVLCRFMSIPNIKNPQSCFLITHDIWS